MRSGVHLPLAPGLLHVHGNHRALGRRLGLNVVRRGRALASIPSPGAKTCESLDVSDRWERILDQKPVSLQEHLLDEAAKLLLSDLRTWPLPIEELDEQTGASIAEFFAPDAPRPSSAVLGAALKLARWDLDREHEAYDEFMRNRRYQETGITEGERPVLLFVSRWVLEQLLALSDATEGRVDRRALLRLVDRLEVGLARTGEAR
jgi:hypothetical protein